MTGLFFQEQKNLDQDAMVNKVRLRLSASLSADFSMSPGRALPDSSFGGLLVGELTPRGVGSIPDLGNDEPPARKRTAATCI